MIRAQFPSSDHVISHARHLHRCGEDGGREYRVGCLGAYLYSGEAYSWWSIVGEGYSEMNIPGSRDNVNRFSASTRTLTHLSPFVSVDHLDEERFCYHDAILRLVHAGVQEVVAR